MKKLQKTKACLITCLIVIGRPLTTFKLKDCDNLLVADCVNSFPCFIKKIFFVFLEKV